MTDELFMEIGIGTRCRRNYETLSTEMDKIYKSEQVDLSVREFPILYSLMKKGPLAIAEIQKLSGLSHSAVSQTVKKLAAKDLLSLEKADDARSKIVTLSRKGKRLVEKLKPIWETARRAMNTVLRESNTNILDAFGDFEAALKRKSFTQRYQGCKGKISNRSKVDIIPYHMKYSDDWRRINQYWIEKYFKMEEADIVSLLAPEENILAQGGEIYMGLLNGKPVGAIALKYDSPGHFELSKMGVMPEAQGHGIAKLLISKVIERYKARAGKKLFLETNSMLLPAITLYKKMGFVEVPRFDTPYERADYFMVYKGG